MAKQMITFHHYESPEQSWLKTQQPIPFTKKEKDSVFPHPFLFIPQVSRRNQQWNNLTSY